MTPALLPDSLGTVTDPHGLYFWYVLLAVIALALLASRRRTAGERERALLPFVVWFLAATLSVIERRHFAYAFLAVGTAIALAGRALWDPRRGGALRIAAVLLIAWAIVVPRPLGLAGAFEGAFRHREAAAEGYVYPQGPGRWKGAGFRPGEVAAIRAARVFVGANLAPGETWLDFASVPSLYWFLDRRCPIRWYEVSFYENPPEQGEVVRALATDRRIRAVLVHFPALGDPIDGIPNAARAPQVWESIRRDFHPAFSEAGVEFWLRNPDR
jgi:hypothetical protein